MDDKEPYKAAYEDLDAAIALISAAYEKLPDKDAFYTDLGDTDFDRLHEMLADIQDTIRTYMD